ncbi:glycoside hydrolase [Marmoricola endophyticus]|uniref:Glycoside hydrolase n=1 Tax=Marmoricola endophyticus TaxID=2040280 RepID=A0A917BN40_9ACTN|nr:LamG-like jellyroll fold domain-containing protein [Marmoricola endophyticus]GGF51220.1 glycoside hydrolase [Marmoricola endophyticus]
MHLSAPRRGRRRWTGVAAAVAVVLSAGLGATQAPATGAAPDRAAKADLTPKTPPLTTPWTKDVSADNALPEYPRPQMTRSAWQNLNGEWQFAAAASAATRPDFGQDLGERVLVPYPIESALSGIQRHEDHMIYRRTFEVPASWRTNAANRLLLHFGAVDYQARVWVNGQQVATHKGGYEAFSADVTDALTRSGPQELVVAVTDYTDPKQQPVGKQRVRAIDSPGGIEYVPASGIWQTVWMEPVRTAHVEQVVATTQQNRQGFNVRVNTAGAKNPQVTVTAYDDGKKVGQASGAGDYPLSLKIRDPHLWTPDDPHLYDFTVVLKDRGKRADTVSSYAGLRTIATQKGADGKQHIVLNGKPVFLNATLDQGYWPDGIYTAPTDEALAFDLQAHKKLGFNAVRKHIKVEPDRWYYHADKLGLLVWQDMPSLNDGEPPRAVQDAYKSELRQIIAQHRGDTSIIGWVPFNEGWGEWSSEGTGEVADMVKAMDPTRLVDAHSGVNCCNSHGDSGKGDVIDWHTYTGPASPSPTADRAAIDGEHGGFGLVVPGHVWPGQPGAYQMAKSKEELTDLYVANQRKLLEYSEKCGLSGGIYTQITDVEDEVNGLYTYDRKQLKMRANPVRRINEALSASGNLGVPPTSYPPGTPGLGGTHAYAADEASGTTVADGVGSADLTTSGGVGRTAGVEGNALSFDGTGAAESAKPVVDTTKNFSVSAWVKLDATGGGFQTAVSQDGDQASAFFLQYDGGANKFAFSTKSGRAYADTTAKAGQWYHLVGVRDAAAQTYTLYVDGEKQGSFGQCLGDESTGPLAVGRAKYDGNPVDRLKGAVDQVTVFDRALSDSEVGQVK